MARPYGVPGATPVQVATAKTTATGKFSLSVTPTSSQSYSVKVDPISQVVIDTLDPVFGDLLQGTGPEVGSTKVVGTTKVTNAKVSGKYLSLKGSVTPKATGSKARVEIWAAKNGRTLRKIGTVNLKNGASTFSKKVKLSKGTWKYQVRYVNTRVIEPSATASKKVRVR